MIEGLGIDNVDIDRIDKILGKDHLFRDRIFTGTEIDYCSRQGSPSRSYAARFAAKEAFAKALGTGFIDELDFLQIEVCSDPLGKPYLNLFGEAASIVKNREITKIHLSLTHSDTIASAVVILEK